LYKIKIPNFIEFIQVATQSITQAKESV